MKNLQGRTALVTGASRGIGPHIGRALAKEGGHVALTARSRDALDAAARNSGRPGAAGRTFVAELAAGAVGGWPSRGAGVGGAPARGGRAVRRG